MNRNLLVFLHLAKTGGRSVDTVLRNTYGPGYIQADALVPHRPVGLTDGEFIAPVYGPEELARVQGRCPWMRAIGGHTVTLWSGVHNMVSPRYVAFMREPLARGASHYQFHVATSEQPLDWDAWRAWPEHHQHQVRYFDRAGDPDAAKAAILKHGVFVGLLERFEESLLLMRKLVAPELRVAYRRANTASSNTVARDLLADPERREQIRAMYSHEFPLYAWVRDELWPRYEEAYGPGLAEDAARLREDPGRDFRRWPDLLARVQHRFWFEPWVVRQRRRG